VSCPECAQLRQRRAQAAHLLHTGVGERPRHHLDDLAIVAFAAVCQPLRFRVDAVQNSAIRGRGGLRVFRGGILQPGVD
jgi:hypothetical protein